MTNQTKGFSQKSRKLLSLLMALVMILGCVHGFSLPAKRVKAEEHSQATHAKYLDQYRANSQDAGIYEITNDYFFQSNFEMLGAQNISAFTSSQSAVKITGTGEYVIGDLGADLETAEMMTIQQVGKWVQYRYRGFGGTPGIFVRFPNAEAAKSATLEINYGVIGTFDDNGEVKNVVMKARLYNLQPHVTYMKDYPGKYKTVIDWPTLQIAASPEKGILMHNIHSMDNEVFLQYEDGTPLNATDMYLTMSSLSSFSD